MPRQVEYFTVTISDQGYTSSNDEVHVVQVPATTLDLTAASSVDARKNQLALNFGGPQIAKKLLAKPLPKCIACVLGLFLLDQIFVS